MPRGLSGPGESVIACLVCVPLRILSVSFGDFPLGNTFSGDFHRKTYIYEDFQWVTKFLKEFQRKTSSPIILWDSGASGPVGAKGILSWLVWSAFSRYFECVFIADFHWKSHFQVSFTGNIYSADSQWETRFLKGFQREISSPLILWDFGASGPVGARGILSLLVWSAFF